jgi:hypothetical protein
MHRLREQLWCEDKIASSYTTDGRQHNTCIGQDHMPSIEERTYRIGSSVSDLAGCWHLHCSP